jgi:hypothetical protein
LFGDVDRGTGERGGFPFHTFEERLKRKAQWPFISALRARIFAYQSIIYSKSRIAAASSTALFWPAEALLYTGLDAFKALASSSFELRGKSFM